MRRQGRNPVILPEDPTDADSARISPLEHAHVLLNGTYRFGRGCRMHRIRGMLNPRFR
jgi:hypothetical protein